jgi:hypothetical protein
MPEAARSTLCISSQVGCAQGCRFCLTAKAGFVRNLTAGEIIAQVQRRHGAPPPNPASPTSWSWAWESRWPIMATSSPPSGVITDADVGIGDIEKRRFTVSTAGLVSRGWTTLGRDADVNLAVSLNAADDATRSALMPINRTYPLDGPCWRPAAGFPLPPAAPHHLRVHPHGRGERCRRGRATICPGASTAYRSKDQPHPLQRLSGTAPIRRPARRTAWRRSRTFLPERHHTVHGAHQPGSGHFRRLRPAPRQRPAARLTGVGAFTTSARRTRGNPKTRLTHGVHGDNKVVIHDARAS